MGIAWRNTEERYGRIAMLLHWAVALMFLGLYVSVYFRQWFTTGGTDINMSALHIHLSLGITVAVFVFLRIIYKIWDRQPEEVEGSKWEHFAAKVGHYSLYAIMIIIPLTGYFGTGLGADYFFLFELPKFQETQLYNLVVMNWMGLTWEQFEPPIDFIHKQGGATIVWMLILIHILAALYHHYIKKDNVLRRMLPISLKNKKAPK
jgi:cytochrome b561